MFNDRQCTLPEFGVGFTLPEPVDHGYEPDPYWQRQEEHHPWGNHAGESITVDRASHLLIHQGNADTCRMICEEEGVKYPTYHSFAGDLFTMDEINPKGAGPSF